MRKMMILFFSAVFSMTRFYTYEQKYNYSTGSQHVFKKTEHDYHCSELKYSIDIFTGKVENLMHMYNDKTYTHIQ